MGSALAVCDAAWRMAVVFGFSFSTRGLRPRFGVSTGIESGTRSGFVGLNLINKFKVDQWDGWDGWDTKGHSFIAPAAFLLRGTGGRVMERGELLGGNVGVHADCDFLALVAGIGQLDIGRFVAA